MLRGYAEEASGCTGRILFARAMGSGTHGIAQVGHSVWYFKVLDKLATRAAGLQKLQYTTALHPLRISTYSGLRTYLSPEAR